MTFLKLAWLGSGRRGRWFKSSRPDLKSRQLVAFDCGELFLVWCERVTQTMKHNSVSSNRRHVSGCDEGQLLELTVGLELTEFKSSRHSRGSSLVRVLLGELSGLNPNHKPSVTFACTRGFCRLARVEWRLVRPAQAILSVLREFQLYLSLTPAPALTHAGHFRLLSGGRLGHPRLR